MCMVHGSQKGHRYFCCSWFIVIFQPGCWSKQANGVVTFMMDLGHGFMGNFTGHGSQKGHHMSAVLMLLPLPFHSEGVIDTFVVVVQVVQVVQRRKVVSSCWSLASHMAVGCGRVHRYFCCANKEEERKKKSSFVMFIVQVASEHGWSKQQTANSKQQTANSKQQTAK